MGATLLFSQENRPKVGLVLSGGGAKGYAHIGALKVLEEAGVQVDYIGGTSIGAIVGALYASGYSAEELEKIMYSLDLNYLIFNEKNRKELPLFDKTYKEKYILELPFDNFKIGFPNALSSGQSITDELIYLFRHVQNIESFEDLPIPFLAVTTKLSNGESVVFKEGYLPVIVMASGAYPTLFEPVNIRGELYIDGGVRNNYPVQEVIDMGADYIIGVDLQEGLLDDKDLNSAPKIIEQIITYGITEKSQKQSELVDLTISPDITGFSVTSFEEKDAIIKVGEEAAKKVFPQLQEVAKSQGFPEINHKLKQNESEYLLLTDLNVNGLEDYNLTYIRGKLGIRTPQLTTYAYIREGIKTLYSSGNFDRIYYRVRDNEEGQKTLNIFVHEKKKQQSLKLGLHYDDLFKTGLLLNYTTNRLLFKNSELSFDLILGDFPRFQFNYFLDNGVYPGFGISSSYKRIETGINTVMIGKEEPNFLIDYKFDEILNRAYFQSTLWEKYALGAGLEHQYLQIKTKNLPYSDPFRKIEDSYFLNLYGYLKADNLDHPNFPRNGLKFDGKFKYFLSSGSEDFEPTSSINTKFQFNKSLNSWLSIGGFGEFGFFLNNNTPDSQKFLLGGYVEQNFLNYSRFYGLPFIHQVGDNILIIGAKLQARILRNHYFSGHINMGSVTEEFDDLNPFHYQYSGYGIGYGYDSPLGPVTGMWNYSPATKKGIFNVSLGFWF